MGALGARGVDVHGVENVGHEAAAGGASRLLDIAIGYLVERDGLGYLSHIHALQAAAPRVMVHHKLYSVPERII